MNISDILKAVANGSMNIEDAERLISLHKIVYVDEIARLDVNRELRRGVPEIIYAEGKQYEDLLRIATTALKSKDKVILSRVKDEYFDELSKELSKDATIHASKRGRIIVAYNDVNNNTNGIVGIISAGTSDIGIAEEARLVAEAMGCKTIVSYDVGIAGMHRLFPVLKDMLINDVDAIVVVAGMEGALPSVVASLVDVPVIGVPTSVGYGFGSDGIAALASMLQSCTLGLAVVNIDNGVGAGAFAATIAKRVKKRMIIEKEK